MMAGAVAAAALAFGPFGVALAADAEPTVHQIYEAAAGGRLDEAQKMMDQVLLAHPTSAKAHYVQAELYAREGKFPLARAELTQAEQLEPGLPKENPRSVEALKAQIGVGARSIQGGRPYGLATAPAQPHFPWGTMLILALVVAVFWMLFRRRNSYVQQYPAGGMPAAGAPGTYGPTGYGPVGPGYGAGGGVGSSIAGGLAGGLAAGAGIVAGEELAHHFLDGHGNPVAAPPAEGEWSSGNANSDMGGSDFGVNDPGSWDDSSGGGDSGGGGDWS